MADTIIDKKNFAYCGKWIRHDKTTCNIDIVILCIPGNRTIHSIHSAEVWQSKLNLLLEKGSIAGSSGYCIKVRGCSCRKRVEAVGQSSAVSTCTNV